MFFTVETFPEPEIFEPLHLGFEFAAFSYKPLMSLLVMISAFVVTPDHGLVHVRKTKSGKGIIRNCRKGRIFKSSKKSDSEKNSTDKFNQKHEGKFGLVNLLFIALSKITYLIDPVVGPDWSLRLGHSLWSYRGCSPYVLEALATFFSPF